MVCVHCVSAGDVGALTKVAGQTKVQVYGVQCTKDVPLTSVEDMAQFYLQVCISYSQISIS